MKEQAKSNKQSAIRKLFLMFAAIFLSGLILWGGVEEVNAAEPITYKDESAYQNAQGYWKDKNGRYLLARGGGIRLKATQTAYNLITAVDWQTDTADGWNYISLVGGTPKPTDMIQGVVVRGVRPGLVTLNGRILSTSPYDAQWCDNKFPIRVVEPLTAITLSKSSVSLLSGGTTEIEVETMTPDSLYSLIFSTPITYSSSNTSVATVDPSEGKITAVSGGTATITATTKNGTKATCKVTVKGKSSAKGTSSGAATASKPKKATLKKVSSSKKRTLTVTWSRNSSATGYQAVIATDKKFTKNKKSAAISKNKTTKKTFTKLKSKKKYFAKVRAYKQHGKTKVYGAYSTVQTTRVK